MEIIFKIKREGSLFVIKASVEGRRVMVTSKPYERYNPKNFCKQIGLLQHDKDVIIKGDTSKRAKGREEYTTGISALKRWKSLRHFAEIPFKKYRGYRSTPVRPQQALQRTRVLWDYLSKYGGGKVAAHKILGMPDEKSSCTLCEYVQSTCSQLKERDCRDYCPVDWDGFGHKREDEDQLLCYHYGSPYYAFQHLPLEENRHAAKSVLDLVDLAIRNAK